MVPLVVVVVVVVVVQHRKVAKPPGQEPQSADEWHRMTALPVAVVVGDWREGDCERRV